MYVNLPNSGFFLLGGWGLWVLGVGGDLWVVMLGENVSQLQRIAGALNNVSGVRCVCEFI